MGCSHCMVNASPDGTEMPTTVFGDTLRFIKAQGVPFLMMSGGEPTEHTEVLDYIDYAAREGIQTLLLSNGEFLHAKSTTFRDAVLEAVMGVQVTNDPRFYPRHVERFEHPKVAWETRIRAVSPHGRARDNGLATPRLGPECFNLRSLVRSTGSLLAARAHLITLGKMCTPSVNVDGSISAGESPSCKKIGYVTDSIETIEQNIRLMRCSRCGLIDTMSQAHKRAVGESSLFLPEEAEVALGDGKAPAF